MAVLMGLLQPTPLRLTAWTHEGTQAQWLVGQRVSDTAPQRRHPPVGGSVVVGRRSEQPSAVEYDPIGREQIDRSSDVGPAFVRRRRRGGRRGRRGGGGGRRRRRS